MHKVVIVMANAATQNMHKVVIVMANAAIQNMHKVVIVMANAAIQNMHKVVTVMLQHFFCEYDTGKIFAINSPGSLHHTRCHHST